MATGPRTGGAARLPSRDEDRDGVPFCLEHRVANVAEVFSVGLERPRSVGVHLDAVEVVTGENAAGSR